jgi:NAD(P)-dependent dehydrogenase (short-subunit alcohol dehydrogenase family)
MDLYLKGQRALVTGASKGIGLATCIALAGEGVDLVMVARDLSVLDDAARSIRAAHQVDTLTISADLSRQDEVERVVQEAGPIDILVNNAGSIPRGEITDLDNTTCRQAWDLKVFGFISLCRAVYPVMAARKAGVIINVIGTAGEKLPAGRIAGVTGNAALIAFTRALGLSASKDGIRAVGINPGSTDTPRMAGHLRKRAAEELGDAERWRELCGDMPFGRPAKASEIADAVTFLASPRSAYTTGTVLTVDGGRL